MCYLTEAGILAFGVFVMLDEAGVSALGGKRVKSYRRALWQLLSPPRRRPCTLYAVGQGVQQVACYVTEFEYLINKSAEFGQGRPGTQKVSQNNGIGNSQGELWRKSAQG